MANIREIQTRINSVKDTMKITNAMYLISSTKMRQARKKLADAEPYFYKLQAEIARILRHMPEVSNQYFDSREEIPKEERKIGSVVITGDKGLAGAYNHNVEKAEEEIMKMPGHHKLFVVGELGRHYFVSQGHEIEQKLNGIGIIAGATIFKSSMITNAPSTLPNSRMHKDNGRITISSTMIGATNGTGFAKCLTQCFNPFLCIPEYSIRHILITASAIVTFRSFVGGLNPNNPMILAIPI